MGMDLYVYQYDKEDGYERSFTLTQEQIDYLLSSGVELVRKDQNWTETSAATEFAIDSLFGFNRAEANKLINQVGCRYYYVMINQPEDHNSKITISLKSQLVTGFYGKPFYYDCNIATDYESTIIHATVELPEKFYKYSDSYNCTILVTEVAYFRKPFRHESTPNIVSENSVTMFVDNCTGLGEQAYALLDKYAETQDSPCDPTFLNTDLKILKQLSKLSNDKTFWEDKIISPMTDNPQLLVNINW